MVLKAAADVYEDRMEERAAAAGGGAHGRLLAGESLAYTLETEKQHHLADIEYNKWAAHEAAWHGIEPLIWLFMGIGFLLKFYACFDQTVQPFMSLYQFMISINQVLAGDLMIFMSIFMCLIIARLVCS